MPWKECHVTDERLRFAARLLEGEKMAPLCAEFGISRKTGYKIFDRYKDSGLHALTDRTCRPYRQANRLPPQLEAAIVRLKREYSGRGASKIREKLPLPAIESPLDLFLEAAVLRLLVLRVRQYGRQARHVGYGVRLAVHRCLFRRLLFVAN